MRVHQDLALARQIRAAGCPIHIAWDDSGPSEIPAKSLEVFQVGGVLESSAFEYSAGTGIMFPVQITAYISGLALSWFEIELPWEKMGFRWLDDPLEMDGTSTLYSFAGRHLEFERTQVLNHRADVCRTLRFGQSLRGFLLGNDMALIPDEFRDASRFPATLIVWDQFGRNSRAPLELTAHRRKKYIRRSSARGGLFSKRDQNPVGRVVYNRLPKETPIERPRASDPEFEKMYAEVMREISRKREQEALIRS